MRIGGQYHKCITMKRVSEEMVVVDDVENRVGFINAHSLALVHSINYNVEGYLSGALGLTF